jgi:hypothetical protein
MCEGLKSLGYGDCVRDLKDQTMAHVWGIERPRLWRMCEGLKIPRDQVSDCWFLHSSSIHWQETLLSASTTLLYCTYIYGSSNQREEIHRVADKDSYYCVTERIPDLWQLLQSMFSTTKSFCTASFPFLYRNSDSIFFAPSHSSNCTAQWCRNLLPWLFFAIMIIKKAFVCIWQEKGLYFFILTNLNISHL